MRVGLVLLLACGLSAVALRAQDPYSPVIGHYQLELENDWVRISRASYAPGDKAPMHNHPLGPTVYVYTTDGGPMLFKHGDFALLRRAVKAGQIRFNRGNLERHEVEYQGDLPTEYFRVELKTEPLDLPPKDWRIAADEDAPRENGQIRIRRVVCAASSQCEPVVFPSVVVTPANRTAKFLVPGADIRNEEKVPVRQVWIELKSPPSKP